MDILYSPTVSKDSYTLDNGLGSCVSASIYKNRSHIQFQACSFGSLFGQRPISVPLSLRRPVLCRCSGCSSAHGSASCSGLRSSTGFGCPPCALPPCPVPVAPVPAPVVAAPPAPLPVPAPLMAPFPSLLRLLAAFLPALFLWPLQSQLQAPVRRLLFRSQLPIRSRPPTQFLWLLLRLPVSLLPVLRSPRPLHSTLLQAQSTRLLLQSSLLRLPCTQLRSPSLLPWCPRLLPLRSKPS
ncbi:hypothetical protein L596_012797 [Steinernema carpocapsae]|uniref:Uncharacterized protein n=1 Tax=Steinernema carpocapsae TaxID=34508 RepID=A0A4U5NY63_STECR|nr:hypothetical protein L596_012797 [Steinernema carpocapsae]